MKILFALVGVIWICGAFWIFYGVSLETTTGFYACHGVGVLWLILAQLAHNGESWRRY